MNPEAGEIAERSGIKKKVEESKKEQRALEQNGEHGR